MIKKKRWIFIIGAVLIVIVGVYFGLIAGANNGISEPSVRDAPYKVEADKNYYPIAYGIKADGKLRIELREESVVELNENMEVINKPKIKILEIPAGKWKLFDRISGKEIKPKGG